jgi:hypothetical protein
MNQRHPDNEGPGYVPQVYYSFAFFSNPGGWLALAICIHLAIKEFNRKN